MSKRTIYNSNIFEKIKNIELDYNRRIVDTLNQLQSDGKLSLNHIFILQGTIIASNLHVYALRTKEYSERYDRKSLPDCLILFSYCLQDIPEIWNQISSLYNKGNKLIYDLSKQFKEPYEKVFNVSESGMKWNIM